MMIFAYVDPGLGLLAWQAVVAFFLGLLFHVRKTRTWLLELFRKIFRAGRRPAAPAPALPPSRTGLRQ